MLGDEVSHDIPTCDDDIMRYMVSQLQVIYLCLALIFGNVNLFYELSIYKIQKN